MSNVTEFDSLADLFQTLEVNMQNLDLTETFDTVATDLCESHATFFSREQSPDGVPWHPLEPVTIKAKGHDIILIETGEMRQSVTDRSDGHHIEIVSPDALVWGTDDEKAMYHMEGTSRMPARPFVGFSESSLDLAVERVADGAVACLLAGIN